MLVSPNAARILRFSAAGTLSMGGTSEDGRVTEVMSTGCVASPNMAPYVRVAHRSYSTLLVSTVGRKLSAAARKPPMPAQRSSSFIKNRQVVHEHLTNR